jgi:hypothetical protein
VPLPCSRAPALCDNRPHLEFPWPRHDWQGLSNSLYCQGSLLGITEI